MNGITISCLIKHWRLLDITENVTDPQSLIDMFME